MLPVRELLEICSKYLGEKGTDNLTPKELELADGLTSGQSYEAMSKQMYGSSPSVRSFVKTKSHLYDKLIVSLTHIDGGNSLQRQKTSIHREFQAIALMSIFGFSSAIIAAARRLLRRSTTYQMHNISAELCRKISNRYALKKESHLAESFHKMALNHLELYRKEIEFDWDYAVVRSRYGTQAFQESRTQMQRVIHDMKPHLEHSIRLQLIHFEFSFFLAYIDGDKPSQIETCHRAIEHFRALPYQHSMVINIFTFHILDVHIAARDLAQAELVILSALSEQKTKGSHVYRYNELLFQIYLHQGDYLKALPLFRWIEKNVHKTGQPAYKTRMQVYALYMAISLGEKISLKKLHYNLNKVPRENIHVTLPFLIGKVIYHQQQGELKKAEVALAHLKNYSRLYLRSPIHDRSIAFISQLGDKLDIRSLESGKLPTDKAVLGRNSVEVVQYERLLDMVGVGSY